MVINPADFHIFISSVYIRLQEFTYFILVTI